jgi:murein DD-endopeptidase MepM/ murein hydrolase activator NlpD
MTGAHNLLVATLLLGGCVPPGVSRLPEPALKRSHDPRIEPVLDGLLDEAPVWERRTVRVNARIDANGRRFHSVGAGDTGIAIARAYGIPWRVIVALNSLSDPYILRVGQRLVLPGNPAPSPEARAAAFKIDIDDIATGGTPALPVDGPFPDPSPSRFAGRFTWPLTGTIVESFGPAGVGRVNRGIEISAPSGSDIRAAADGTVAFVGNGGSAGYGGLILVRHGDGWISVYGRAAQATVARGQRVKVGQRIGSIGKDAKLHFELRQNRTAVDPVKRLLPR